jgi:ABC-type transport system involved in multi-copper enzyme maturation permease subunit
LIFKDAFRESLDSKVFYVLAVLSLMVALLFLGFSFHRFDGNEVLERALEDIGSSAEAAALDFRPGPLMGHLVEYRLEEIRPLEDRALEGAAGGYGCRLLLPPTSAYADQLQEFQQPSARLRATAFLWHRTAVASETRWERTRRATVRAVRNSEGRWIIQRRDGEPPWPPNWQSGEAQWLRELAQNERAFWAAEAFTEEFPAPDANVLCDFIATRLRQAGFNRAVVAPAAAPEGGLAFDIRAAYESRGQLKDLRDISVFGVRIPLPLRSTGTVVVALEEFVAEWIGGMGGVGISLVMTSWIFPRMMRKGTIDLVLTKPISRPVLYVYKFLAGSMFAVLSAAILIGGTWLVLSWRSGWWNGWYLLNIPLLGLVFLVPYSVSAFFGTLTRNTIVAIVMSIGAWVLMGTVSVGYAMLKGFEASGLKMSEKLMTAADVVHAVVPKSGEMLAVSQHLAWRSRRDLDDLGPTVAKLQEEFSVTGTLVPSVAFIVLLTGLGAWIFSRRDY